MSLAGLAFRLNGVPYRWNVLFFVLFSTYFFYSLDRWFTRSRSGISDGGRCVWIEEGRVFFATGLFASLAASVFFLFQLKTDTILACVVTGAAGLFYSILGIPWRPGGEPSGLKRFLVLKPAILLGTWSFITLIVPLMEGAGFRAESHWKLVVLWNLWLLGNATIFDLRDVKRDRMDRMKTIPILLGRTNFCKMLIGTAFIQGFFSFLWFFDNRSMIGLISLLIHPFGLISSSIYFKRVKTPPKLLFIFVDLLLGIPLIVLVFFDLQT